MGEHQYTSLTVTVRLKHYLGVGGNRNALKFMLARPTPQYGTDNSPVYDFKEIGSSTGNFNFDKNMGEIVLREFGIILVAYNRGIDEGMQLLCTAWGCGQ
jgi:hypothetical protein